MKSERINLLGCPVDNLSMQETLLLVEEMIKKGNPHQHVVVNADKLIKVRKDAVLREIVSSCDIINADGMPLVWASKILGVPLKERVTGIDLMYSLLRLGSERGYSFYFLGAKEEAINKAVGAVKKLYPHLKISGYRNGYWSAAEEEDVVTAITSARPDVLFVGINSPKKELFLNKYLNKMQVPFVMGVGGSFDVLAGLTKRAPKWMQHFGLEWFWRLIQEPTRLWRRYLINNTKFIFLVGAEIVKKIPLLRFPHGKSAR